MEKIVAIKPYDQSYVGKSIKNFSRNPGFWLKVEYVGRDYIVGVDEYNREVVELLNAKYEVKNGAEDNNKTK